MNHDKTKLSYLEAEFDFFTPLTSKIKYRLKCIIPLLAITFGSAKSMKSAEELVAKATMLKSIANFIFIEISCYNKDKRKKKT